MRSLRFVSAASLLACLLLLPTVATAQTTNAAIVGDVADTTEALIPGATVTVTNTATGVQRSVTTNERGAFRVYPVSPGTYDVTASTEGFRTEIRAGVIVGVAATVKVDFGLELGQVTETIEVTGEIPTLQTQDASVGGTVTNTEIARMPVNGRNYTSLILMIPGTSGQTFSQSRGTQSGTRLIAVNGARPQDNNFTMDGVDNNMMMMNSPGASPPMDAIQEFRVATNNSAEFGRSAGANVNIAIKSGTRELHGAAYWYVRNDKFDANDFFANRSGTGKVPFRQNQYGASIGGPVPKLRESTFWFFNWEGFRRRRGSNRFTNVPTPLQRSGDFSEIPQQIYNPFTGRADANGNIVRDPFANKVIPSSLQHPGMAAALDLMIPLPNLPGLSQNFVNTASAANDRDFIVAKGDHHMGDNDTFSFRYLHQNVGQVSPGSNPFLTSMPRYDVRNYGGNWNHVFSPTAILEVRFGYNNPSNPSCTINSATTRANFLERTRIQMYEREVLCDPVVNLRSEGEFSGGGGGGLLDERIWQYVANFSKTTGSHTIKGGVNYSLRLMDKESSNPMNGDAWFNGELTSLQGQGGFATATYLLGTPRRIRRGTGRTDLVARSNFWQFFVQDDWRVTSKLTVNLGTRYSYAAPMTEKQDRLGNLFVTLDENGYKGNLMWAFTNPEIDPETGLRNQPPKTFGFGRALAAGDKNDIAPRLGIAYQVNSKTVIRTGVGMFYNTTFVQELQDKRKFWPASPQQVFDPAGNNITALNPVPTFFIDDAGPDFSSTSAIGGWPQDPNNRSPYAVQWNFTLQQELMNQTTFEIGYVGSSSRKQIGYTAINSPVTPGRGAIQPRRLLPDFGNLDGGSNRFGGKYHSLQTSLNRRFSGGLGFRLNYTWSKAMDEQSSLAEWKTQDPFNIRNDWSRSSWDLKHVIQISYQWDLPFGIGRRWGQGWNGAADAILGGWALEGYTRYNTGPPFNVVSGRDIANVGRTYQRPDVTCNPNTGPRTAEQWYAVDCYQFPQQFTYGNAGAYFAQADGLNNWDISIGKHWVVKESHRVTLRAELFNAFNSTMFRKPGGRISENWSSSGRGRVGSLSVEPRQIQFVLRYDF